MTNLEKYNKDMEEETIKLADGYYKMIEPTAPKITAHSANPIGCENIEHILGKYGIPCEIKMMGQAYRKK